MSDFIDGKSARKLALGLKVDKASGNLPQTATGAIFNVKGGRVLVKLLLGEVTTIIQNQATNAKLISTPTTGTAVDLCAAADIKTKEVGTLITITGTFTDALAFPNAGAVAGMAKGVIVPIGSIGLNTDASSTGAAKWSICYVPIDDGAYVEAA